MFYGKGPKKKKIKKVLMKMVFRVIMDTLYTYLHIYTRGRV